MGKAETKLTKKITDRLAKLKAQGYRLWWLKVHGNAFQKAGVPDLCVVFEGRAIFLEVKTDGKDASKLQDHVIQRIRDAGGVACVVRSVDEAEAAILRRRTNGGER